MNAEVGAIKLGTWKPGPFDSLVQGGRRLLGGVTEGVSRKLRPVELEDLHAVQVPQHLELQILDLQRSLIKYFKTNGINLSPEQSDDDVKKQIPKVMTLMLDMETANPEFVKQINAFVGAIEKFATGQQISPERMTVLIKDIKCPELGLVHITFGNIVFGAIMTGAMKWLLAPPPSPPSPSSLSAKSSPKPPPSSK